MRQLIFIAAFMLLALSFAPAQFRPQDLPPNDRLPSGKSQKEEILKADHEKSLQDSSELMKLSEELKIDLEKNDRHVLSVSTLKKLDEMEKLVKRIRSRLKRF